jgi:hypothetical protein
MPRVARLGLIPKRGLKQIQNQLKLTDDQTSKILYVLQIQAAQISQIREANNGNKQAISAATKRVVQASDHKIEAILTPEQAEAYKNGSMLVPRSRAAVVIRVTSKLET